VRKAWSGQHFNAAMAFVTSIENRTLAAHFIPHLVALLNRVKCCFLNLCRSTRNVLRMSIKGMWFCVGRIKDERGDELSLLFVFQAKKKQHRFTTPVQ